MLPQVTSRRHRLIPISPAQRASIAAYDAAKRAAIARRQFQAIARSKAIAAAKATPESNNVAAANLSPEQCRDFRDIWSVVRANGWTDDMSEVELDALEAGLLRAVGAMPTADWMKLVRVLESRRRSRLAPEPPAGWRAPSRNDNRGPTSGW
jgi:hypothetical protein